MLCCLACTQILYTMNPRPVRCGCITARYIHISVFCDLGVRRADSSDSGEMQQPEDCGLQPSLLQQKREGNIQAGPAQGEARKAPGNKIEEGLALC